MTGTANHSSHRLMELSVIGGFLDGLKMDFHKGLNCIIGARGTGKTTALEFVRFVMDKVPESSTAGKRLETLAAANLGSGRIELKIGTKDGLNYTVSRTCGEAPMVLDANGEPTCLSLKTGSLFNIDIYSQNEVENMADNALSQLELIDNFAREKVSDIEQQIRNLKSQLASNSNSLIPLYEKHKILLEVAATLPAVEEKLKSYGTEAGENTDEINKAHALKGQRDREHRSMETADKLLCDAEQYITGNLGYIQNSLQNVFPKEIFSGANGNIVKGAAMEMFSCGENADGLLKQVAEMMRQCREKLSGHRAKLDLLHKQQEIQFRALIEKHKEGRSKASERISLERRRNELLGIKNEMTELEKKAKKLKGERNALLSRFSELRDARFHVRQEIVNHINRHLSPSIHVSIKQYENREAYCNFMSECLKNPRMQYRKVAEKIAHALWPSCISALIREKNIEKLMENADLNENQAKYVLGALEKPEILHKLETVELMDLPQIELNDHGTYKTTASLSTGQKCNTILPILLLDSENPLLIDQPEDNLDNGFVHNTIVESIHKVKGCRQMIFVTHNPNIPVLGDAERIFVLESDGTSAAVRNSGGVDKCKQEIVSLLEGGEEAFKKRKNRYSY